MRIIRPAVALLVALSLAAAALTYLRGRSWEDRIYIRDHRSSLDHLSYHSTFSGNGTRAAHRAAPTSPDPYHQRYYSESEGWTYYALPSYGSGHARTNE